MGNHLLLVFADVVLSAIACWTAVRDAKSRILSDKLSLALLIAGLFWDIVLRVTWIEYAMHLVFAIFVLLLLIVPFYKEKIGGGDVKLWVVTCLFIPFDLYVVFLVLLLIALVITLIVSLPRYIHKERKKIPFGVPFCIPFVVTVWCAFFIH